MADPLALAERHRRAAVALQRRTEGLSARVWRGLDTGNLDRSWIVDVRPSLVGLVMVAQRQAASGADDYTAAVLEAQGIPDTAGGEIVPAQFAGVASDGRPLDSLLYEPVITTKVAIGRGAPAREAAAAGLAQLLMVVGTQVADAGRTADGVAIATRPRAGGYVRMLSLPSCDRCVILAGKFFRLNTGFQRHPRCDCRHIPSTENLADDLTTDPRKAIESGQVRGLSASDTRAIVDGADPGAVVNARRGMYEAGGRKLTRESTTRHGFSPGLRPRPEQIYRDATSRDEAVDLLRRFGYIR